MAEPSINDIQANILRRMFEQDGQRFSELNTAKLPTDQFSYHLRQLSKAKLIEKLSDQTYRLTNHGRAKTIMLAPTSPTFIQQGYIAVLLIVSKKQAGQELFLAHQRNKVPYKDKIGFFGDKVRFGENTLVAAKRALTLQTGLTGSPQLQSIWHMIDEFDGTIVEDKYFFVYSVTDFNGEPQPIGVTGKNIWMTQQEIESSGQMFHNIDQFINSTRSSGIHYEEQLTKVDSY